MNRSSLIRQAMRSLPSATFAGVLLISLNMAVAAPANAAIYKCISDTGSVTYSGRKCPEEEITERIIADSGVGSTDQRRAPAAAKPIPATTPAEREKRIRESELEPQPDWTHPLTSD